MQKTPLLSWNGDMVGKICFIYYYINYYVNIYALYVCYLFMAPFYSDSIFAACRAIFRRGFAGSFSNIIEMFLEQQE